MPEPTMEQKRPIEQLRWHEHQKVQLEESVAAQKQIKSDMRYVNMSKVNGEWPPPLRAIKTDLMYTWADFREDAPPATVKESRREKKKREEREKAADDAHRAEWSARDQVGRMRRQFNTTVMTRATPLSDNLNARGKEFMVELAEDEEDLLRERQKAADLREKADRLEAEGEGTLTEDREREISWQAQDKRAKALGGYARTLPMGSKERAKAMAEKEAAELKADKLRRLYKVTQIEDPAERRREEKTIKRHAHYDALKKVFRRDNPLAHEDATWKNQLPGGGVLVNTGRAFFGGTKPMYTYTDYARDAQGRLAPQKDYLFKEAVNCLGMYKPEGALVTEAASKLQQIVCGENAIPAFAVRDEKGKVLGSFQEKLEVKKDGVDLFSWQAHPDTDLLPETKTEILREHTLDWLLCNFDTKGENFLTRPDGHLSSFDKEASFSFLKDKGSQHMSRTYKPHANDTLYNVVFTKFAEGELDLDLNDVIPQLDKVKDLSREEYLGMFGDMLTEKYGEAGEKNTARAKAEEAIWSRKANLREEYRAFFTGLLEERRAKLGDQNPDAHGDLLDAEGRFRFRDEIQEGGAQ